MSRFPYHHQGFAGDQLEFVRDLLAVLEDADIVWGRKLVASFVGTTFVVVEHGLERRMKGALVLGQADTSYDVRHLSDESIASLVDYESVAVFEARDAAGSLVAITDDVPVWIF